jgi:uncharacterized protein (TIGR02231 family)
MELESRITDVTVYADRAQVTRTASVQLQSGEQQLRFAHLADLLERNSLQVDGTGDFVLRDVAFASEHFAATPDSRRKEFADQRRKLDETLRELDGKQKLVVSEKAFLDGIAQKLTGITEKSAPPEFDPDRWIEMVKFYRIRLEALDAENRALDKATRDTKDEIGKIDAQMADLGREVSKKRNVVDVTVEAEEATEGTLSLSYIVYGPSWIPLYDLRVSRDEKKMHVTYSGMVSQNTGEDWEEVAVSLSTAQPSVGGEEPKLDPWRIDYYRPESMPTGLIAPRPAAAPGGGTELQETTMVTVASAAAETLAEPPQTMIVEEAKVQTGATSVVFAAGSRASIPSDNNPHRVSIMMQDFDAEFRYSTVPKLAPFAYLKAKVSNETNYPFLPGEANVFFDGGFVCNSSLEFVAPGQEFTTSLGIDEAIEVERKLLKQYQKDEGVISKKTKLVFEWQIEITNHRKTDEEIHLRDQLPISGNKEIVVELMEPKMGRPDSPERNEHDYLTWKLELGAGQEVRIPLTFTIEYPQGEKIRGLEQSKGQLQSGQGHSRQQRDRGSAFRPPGQGVPGGLMLATRDQAVKVMVPTGESRVIGRFGDADARMTEDTVSRKHARVYDEDGSWLIEDLGSTGGTWVNGQQIQEATRLGVGDEVRIGRLVLWVSM